MLTHLSLSRAIIRSWLPLLALALSAACSSLPTASSTPADQRLAVADLCNQADNANRTLTAQADKLTPAQIDQWAQAKAVADTICLDQSAAASSATLEQKLRSSIPMLVALIPVKE